MVDLPLPTLLSACLVAFTIEFDNTFETRMPHRTTRGPARTSHRGPWLTSQVMWANVMRHVPAAGLTVGELHAAARTAQDALAGLSRWGYVSVTPADALRAKGVARQAARVVPTATGRRAQQVWAPLGAEIEGRWVERHGAEAVTDLRRGLRSLADRLDPRLPDYLPIVHPALGGGRAECPLVEASPRPVTDDDDLSVLLSRVLLAFTHEVEAAGRLSMATGVNTLRLLGEEPVAERDLPARSGVSKEAQTMNLAFLERRELAMGETDPATGRGRAVRLTEHGARVQRTFAERITRTQAAWRDRFGRTDVDRLLATLNRLVGEVPLRAASPLFAGLVPPPGTWRAAARAPETLPHHPMVLHRGGYPDGS